MTAQLDADLVLEGGGVKGIALAGAISVLDERGYRFRKVAGTSAGSIVGALVAAGASGTRLHELMSDIEYHRVEDPPWYAGRRNPLGIAARVLLHQGWCRGDYLRSWLTDALAEFGVRTFEQLPLDDPGADPALRRDPERAYRFVAMASDLTHRRLTRLPWDYREWFGVEPGEASVADAVRASMAIPYFFVPARLPDPEHVERAWLVDGGMLSNFPVDVFDRNDGREPRWPTFGIKLSGRPEEMQVNRVRGVVSLTKAMVTTMTGFYDAMHAVRPEVVERTIFVDTDGVRSTDFSLDRGRAEDLFERGRRAATAFLDGDGTRPAWDFEAYKRRWALLPAPVEAGAARVGPPRSPSADERPGRSRTATGTPAR